MNNKRNVLQTVGLRATTLLLLAITSATSFAQYNKVFYNALGPSGLQAAEAGRDIVDAGNGHTCVLSSTNTIFSIKELDVTGNVVCEETFFVQEWVAEQLIKAPNGDYLVVGHAWGSTLPELHPFVGRFRKDPLNPGKFICLWLYKYLTNNNAGFVNRAFAWRTSIVLAEDDPQESYIVVAPADDSNTPVNGTGTTTIQAFKISASGTLVWNKKYYDQGASGAVMNHFVTTLAYGEIAEGQGVLKKYFIGGNNDETVSFDMTIDGNGNIVNQYREYDMPSGEHRQAVLFDNSTQEFVLANSISSNSAGNSIHQIAVTKIDFSTMALSPTDYYYEDDPSSNDCLTWAEDIVEDATQTHYLVGGVTRKDNNGTGVIYSGPTVLKIDKASNVQYLNRYNRLGESHLAAIITTVDGGGTEYYAACGSVRVMPGDNTRVFTTDVAGVTCGEESLNYRQGSFNLSPSAYTFADASITGRTQETPLTYSSYQVRDCNPANPEYKPAPSGIAAIANSDFSLTVYPNPIVDKLTVQLGGHIDRSSKLAILDLMGKIVYNIPVTSDEIVIDATKLPAGIYLLQYTSNGGREQVKFVKQ